MASVIATEIDPAACAALRQRFAGERVEIREVLPGDESIFEEECDVFAPNALGGVLSPEDDSGATL